MAPDASRRDDDTHSVKLLCSHGGRFQPRGPGGGLRYVGGETRVIALPRAVSFRDLAARLAAEMAGGSGSASDVRVIMHRLADEGLEDVIVSVTCDQEVAHMHDEYDRLRATRPAARFRVFIVTTGTNTAPAGSNSKRATTVQRPSPGAVDAAACRASRRPPRERASTALRVQESGCSFDIRDREGGGGFHRSSEGEGEEQRRPGGRGEQKGDLRARVRHGRVRS